MTIDSPGDDNVGEYIINSQLICPEAGAGVGSLASYSILMFYDGNNPFVCRGTPYQSSIMFNLLQPFTSINATTKREYLG